MWMQILMDPTHHFWTLNMYSVWVGHTASTCGIWVTILFMRMYVNFSTSEIFFVTHLIIFNCVLLKSQLVKLCWVRCYCTISFSCGGVVIAVNYWRNVSFIGKNCHIFAGDDTCITTRPWKVSPPIEAVFTEPPSLEQLPTIWNLEMQ